MVEINLTACNQDPETCPVVESLFEHDAFMEQISVIEPSVGIEENRQLFANFVVACVKGHCPGIDPELCREIINQPKSF